MQVIQSSSTFFFLLFLCPFQGNWVFSFPTNPGVKFSCNGDFDVYFVLDLSSSLIRGFRNHFQDETVSFVRDLVRHFTSPLSRLSFITFNTYADVVLPLTSDRNVVNFKLQQLAHSIPGGLSYLELGLEKVNLQIRSDGGRRASIVIVLTDGNLDPRSKILSVLQATIIRNLGGTVLVVGVGNSDPNQLLDIAGGVNHLTFQTASFDGLQKIVNQVIDSSCVEITSATPTTVCTNSSFDVHINGRGFNKAGNLDRVKCNFQFNKQRNFLVTPAEMTPFHLICPSPENVAFEPNDVITLQVTLNNGISFISSNVTITSSSCQISGGLIIGTILPFLILLLLLLWWFSNACCCVAKTVQSTKKEIPKPKPLSPPPRPPMRKEQWPVVDASYYGGRGAGGINPMKVKWGGKGCTEGGMHLEKTKDAQEVGYVEKEVMDPDKEVLTTNPDRTSSSCGKCTNCLKPVYLPLLNFIRKLSKRKPSREDLRRCVVVKPRSDDGTYRLHQRERTDSIYYDAKA